ncbi:TRAF-like family protein [Euphorbia peplus]|nr:TRAF-like family protein [Euphorbia peplus]
MLLKETCTAARIIKPKIKRSKRVTPPSDYILKINSFSQLSEIVEKTGNGKYESDEFEAADYKWTLVLYPNGNLKANGEGHISLYLASTDKEAISGATGGLLNVFVTFFVYDHIQDKYLSIQDGKVKRYHVLKTEHGFDQLLPLVDFNDPSNGYVVDDCCAFGVEAHAIKNTVQGNELSFINDPPNGTFTWKIHKFSTLVSKGFYSEGFSAGGCKWKLWLSPTGELEEKDRSLSLYLHLDANTCESKVYVEYDLMVKDQLNGIHHEFKENQWFEIGEYTGWGYPSFMLLEDLRDESKGFLVDDNVVIQAKITLVGVSQDLISKAEIV